MTDPAATPKSLPSIATLRCFESAARHQSFTLASEELNLTQGAVSRHVKELEAQLGFQLFRRIGRNVELTKSGANFAQNIRSDLSRFTKTIHQAIAAGAAKQSLNIASMPTFAERWLIPRLSLFEQQCSDIEVNITSRWTHFDLVGEGYDLAIHFGNDNWPASNMIRLCNEELIAVASPDLLAQYRAAEEVLQYAPLLHLDHRPTEWSSWFKTCGFPEFQRQEGRCFDQFSMIITAACHGLGMALLPSYLIENELASGALVRVSTQYRRTNRYYFAVLPFGIVNPVAQQFVNWIKGEIVHSQQLRQQRELDTSQH